MKNKIIKEKQKIDRKRNNKIRKWWKKNNYKVIRVILFPIWIYAILEEKYKKSQHAKIKKCQDIKPIFKKYLDKVMPFMVAHYCENAKQILISSACDMGDINFSNFCSSTIQKKYSRIENFFAIHYKGLKEYILSEYQIEGYKKMILDNYRTWNEAKEKFDWGDTPFNVDYCKGVVFYINEEE